MTGLPLNLPTNLIGWLPFVLSFGQTMGGDKPLFGQAIGYFGLTVVLQFILQHYDTLLILFRGESMRRRQTTSMRCDTCDLTAGQLTTAIIREDDLAFEWLHMWLADYSFGQRDRHVPLWADLLETVFPTGIAPPRHMELTTYHYLNSDGDDQDVIRAKEMKLRAFPIDGELDSPI